MATIAFVIEGMFPPLFLPGARMGVSNVFILLSAILLGGRYGFAVLIVKILLGSLLSGNVSSAIYSLPSGILALSIELILLYFTNKISVVAISVFGAVLNSTVQNAVFCIVTKTPEYLAYLPYLALIGAVAGLIIGLAVYLTVKKFSFDKLINS